MAEENKNLTQEELEDKKKDTSNKIKDAVSQSWKNPEVAEKRKARHIAVVDGVEYNSVDAAFKALGLPSSKMHKFRKSLKENGEQVFEHEGVQYKFESKPYVKAEKPSKKDAAKGEATAAVK